MLQVGRLELPRDHQTVQSCTLRQHESCTQGSGRSAIDVVQERESERERERRSCPAEEERDAACSWLPASKRERERARERERERSAVRRVRATTLTQTPCKQASKQDRQTDTRTHTDADQGIAPSVFIRSPVAYCSRSINVVLIVLSFKLLYLPLQVLFVAVSSKV